MLYFILGDLPRNSEPALQSSSPTPWRLPPRCTRILHEAEAAGGFLDFVQPHDDLLNVAAFAEELVDLLLRGVEGEVPHVQCAALPQQPLLVVPRPLGRKNTALPRGPARPDRTARRPPPAAAHPEMLVPVLAEFSVGVAAQDAQRAAGAHGGVAEARPGQARPTPHRTAQPCPAQDRPTPLGPARPPLATLPRAARPAVAQPIATRCAALASAAGRGVRHLSREPRRAPWAGALGRGISRERRPWRCCGRCCCCSPARGSWSGSRSRGPSAPPPGSPPAPSPAASATWPRACFACATPSSPSSRTAPARGGGRGRAGRAAAAAPGQRRDRRLEREAAADSAGEETGTAAASLRRAHGTRWNRRVKGPGSRWQRGPAAAADPGGGRDADGELRTGRCVPHRVAWSDSSGEHEHGKLLPIGFMDFHFKDSIRVPRFSGTSRLTS